MADVRLAPAYYVGGRGRLRDWWAILHPPYTAWHLSYVVIGAALAPALDPLRLVATLLAFFLAVGVSAHALDELNGRPLGTQVPRITLLLAATIGLVCAVAVGAVGIDRLGPGLIPFVVTGAFFVLAYNLELFDGRVHSDVWFALAWGAFPVLTGYFAQTAHLAVPAVLAGAGAAALSYAQRSLSTPARTIRRRARSVQGTLTLLDGSVQTLDPPALLGPLERALRALSWGIVALATAMAFAHLPW